MYYHEINHVDHASPFTHNYTTLVPINRFIINDRLILQIPSLFHCNLLKHRYFLGIVANPAFGKSILDAMDESRLRIGSIRFLPCGFYYTVLDYFISKIMLNRCYEYEYVQESVIMICV